jgi:nucleotide-binding universal stress UspA family protein
MNETTSGVFVGVDGSDESMRAVEWAAADAARRDTGLTICHVIAEDLISGHRREPLAPQIRRLADRMLAAAADRAAAVAPGVAIQRQVCSGHPAKELITRAREAQVLVLGRRGHSSVLAVLLGSIGLQVAGHAPVPVVVTRGDTARGGPVVVAVDGSASSAAALRFGIDHARRTGSAVVAVHVVPYPLTAPATPMAPSPTLRVTLEDAEQIRKEGAALLDEVVDRVPADGVEADRRVLQGATAGELVAVSAAASLLVVGSRGRGGFAGLVLGSVSQHALAHAAAPVAVIHA